MKTLSVATAIAVLALAPAPSAMAGPIVYDHLACMKIRDSISYRAIVDLTPQIPNNLDLPVQTGCQVKLKSKEFCVPVSKTVVETDDPDVIPVVGQDLVPGFFCYAAKCKSPDAGSLEAGDQFGVRTVAAKKIVRLCAPADW